MSPADSLPFDSLTLADVNAAINDIDCALINPAYAFSIAGSSMQRSSKAELEDTLIKLKVRRAILMGLSPAAAQAAFMPSARFYVVTGARL